MWAEGMRWQELYKKANSTHRRKIRVWQLACALAWTVNDYEALAVVEPLIWQALRQSNQPTVRQYQELFAVRLVLRFPELLHSKVRLQVQAALAAINETTRHAPGPSDEVQAAAAVVPYGWFRVLNPRALCVQCMTPRVVLCVRTLAQVLPMIGEPNCSPAIMSSYIHVVANVLLHTPDPAVQARSPAQTAPAPRLGGRGSVPQALR
jgi:hypothetical protein